MQHRKQKEGETFLVLEITANRLTARKLSHFDSKISTIAVNLTKKVNLCRICNISPEF